jgi:hypothetical protein
MMDSSRNNITTDLFSNEMQGIWQENVSKRIIQIEEKVESLLRNSIQGSLNVNSDLCNIKEEIQ